MHQYLNYRGSRRREKKKGCEKIFEDIVENSPNMEKELVNQVQEVQTAPYRINPGRNMPRHILIKLTKIKHEERILKVARERKQVIYNGKPMCLTAHLSTETLQARREWQDIFKALKGGGGPTTSITVPNKDLIQILWRNKNKKLFKQAKVENSVPANQLYKKC